tara:strand:+ start:384 stop:788 length:405 start_codon:yes stop_codon:yes gene_type:complete
MPSEFKESFTRYLKSTVETIFAQRSEMKYNPDNDCIEVSFNCRNLGIEFPPPKISLFEDIKNEKTVPSGEYSTSFIYHQFLNGIKEKSNSVLEGYAQQMSNDVIFRIGRYIGASNKINGSYLRDDSVWERVHND